MSESVRLGGAQEFSFLSSSQSDAAAIAAGEWGGRVWTPQLTTTVLRGYIFTYEGRDLLGKERNLRRLFLLSQSSGCSVLEACWRPLSGMCLAV